MSESEFKKEPPKVSDRIKEIRKDYRGQWERRVCPKCKKKTLGIFYCSICGYNLLKDKKYY